MTPLTRALAVAALQVGLIGAVAGTLYFERATLPRAWMESAGFDPDLPIRGRYVALNLLPASTAGAGWPTTDGAYACGRLEVRDGAVVAVAQEPTASGLPSTGSPCFIRRGDGSVTTARWQLVQPVAFFLPEHVRDPTLDVQPGELWVEVTVPPDGAPRPIRLGLRRDDGIEPIR
ncbi:MAG TPA: hypothetical protein VNS57_00420 [Steroidobacteraceae bacterium]|nr:hypothetical protein [Steroidobacteraceae bacterium]